jgi:hypothetical protein
MLGEHPGGKEYRHLGGILGSSSITGLQNLLCLCSCMQYGLRRVRRRAFGRGFILKIPRPMHISKTGCRLLKTAGSSHRARNLHSVQSLSKSNARSNAS